MIAVPEPTQVVPVSEKEIPLPSNPVAIYKTSDGWAAIIDRQIVRQGDILSTGHRVVHVSHEGIQLQHAGDHPSRGRQ
ncbi:MAG: hypothetical protein R3C05_23265 [Pirellulaceae bacterium]